MFIFVNTEMRQLLLSDRPGASHNNPTPGIIKKYITNDSTVYCALNTKWVDMKIFNKQEEMASLLVIYTHILFPTIFLDVQSRSLY